MNDSLDHGPEADDRPQRIDTGSRTMVPYRPQPSRSGRLFRWWLGLSLLLAIAVALCVLVGVNQFDLAPMHIVIDGDDVGNGITINGLSDGGRALVAVGVLLFALLLLLLIPLLLVLVLGSVAIAVVCAIGVPLVVVALVLGALTSPLWLVGLMIWLAVRRRHSHPPARSATMTA